MNQQTFKFIAKITVSVYQRNLCRPVALSSLTLKNVCTSSIRNKNFLTDADSYGYKKPSFVENVVDKVKLGFRKHKLQAAGCYLYECVADNVHYDSIMKEFNMPDTFHSWFLITELHLWMVMVRMMADPQYGKVVRNAVVEALWKDVITRSKKLGTEQMTIVKSQIMELSEEFQAALVTYDEGILSDDTILASALWRRILSKNCDARQLEAMVKYVRQTVFYLHSLTIEEFLIQRKIKWIPIVDVFKSLPK